MQSQKTSYNLDMASLTRPYIPVRNYIDRTAIDSVSSAVFDLTAILDGMGN